jgi:hypothetical protein
MWHPGIAKREVKIITKKQGVRQVITAKIGVLC